VGPDRYGQLFQGAAASIYGKSPGKGTRASEGSRFWCYTHRDKELCRARILVYVIVLVDSLFP